MRLDFNGLPPVETLAGMDDLQALVKEHAETLEAWREGKRQHERMGAALADARHMDETAAVEAYRKGKKEPGPVRENKVRAEQERLEKMMRVREGVLASVEKEIAGAAQKARTKIPAIEEAVREDNARLGELLEEVRLIQRRRARWRGLVEWLTKLPPTFRPVSYAQDGLTEDVALNVLVASTVEPEEGVSLAG
jgi:DNA repair exonuclease SbcCD ATPase subunit